MESKFQISLASFLTGKMKQVGIDYAWEQSLKDEKETHEFCLWSKTYDRWLVTLRILDFPDQWFGVRVSLRAGLSRYCRWISLKATRVPAGLWHYSSRESRPRGNNFKARNHCLLCCILQSPGGTYPPGGTWRGPSRFQTRRQATAVPHRIVGEVTSGSGHIATPLPVRACPTYPTRAAGIEVPGPQDG
jgi:hypothetical protein